MASSSSDIGNTELIRCIRQCIEGKATEKDVETVVAQRGSSINIAAPDGATPLHIACTPSSATYSATRRQAVLAILVKEGANVYSLDPRGNLPWEVCSGQDAEDCVAVILKHRVQHEAIIPSTAPMFASRIMKRSVEGRSGSGVYSCVSPHCLYYLYQGAIYLWDTLADVEHVVYQPRDVNPNIAAAATQIEEVRRRRSVYAHTKKDATHRAAEDFQHEEDELQSEIMRLETTVKLAKNFTVFVGLLANKAHPNMELTEYVLCDGGILISVTMNGKGVVLKEGLMLPSASWTASPSSGRRKSQVCGVTAQYPEGKSPALAVSPRCCIKFLSRPCASDVCVAVDPVRGVVAYVGSFEDECPDGEEEEASPPVGDYKFPAGANPFCTTPPTDAQEQPPEAPHRRSSTPTHVGFNLPPSADEPRSKKTSPKPEPLSNVRLESSLTVGSNSPSGSPTNFERLHELKPSKCDLRFRIILLKDMAPKTGFDDAMHQLCSRFEPLSGCEITDFPLAADMEPIRVRMCGAVFAILFTTVGPVLADVSQRKKDEPVQFFRVPTNPKGNVWTGDALATQRFRPVRSVTPLIFAQVSDIVEVIEVTPKRETIPLMVIGQDRMQPMRYHVAFHPGKDQLMILYQSLKRQELVAYNFNTKKIGTVCRLPKPSSLLFFGDNVKPVLLDLCFAFSRAGEYLLRYNTTMHVMSIYPMEEAEANQQDINCTFIREPIKVEKTIFRQQVEIKKSSPNQEATWAVFMLEHPDEFLPEARADAVGGVDAIVRRVAKSHTGTNITAGGGKNPFWAAYFDAPLDAACACVELARVLMDESWTPPVMATPHCAAVEQPYKSKMQEMAEAGQFPEEKDPHASHYLWRGPVVTSYLVSGKDTTTPIAAADTLRHDASDAKGVVVGDAEIMKILRPLLDLTSPNTKYQKHGKVSLFVPQELAQRLTPC